MGFNNSQDFFPFSSFLLRHLCFFSYKNIFIVHLYFLGGTDIKVFDAFAGGRLLAKITQHHKTVTCLTIASNGHRILSGSLDRHVQIYDAGTYNTIHTLDYPNAVLSIGISVSRNRLFSLHIKIYVRHIYASIHYFIHYFILSMLNV